MLKKSFYLLFLICMVLYFSGCSTNTYSQSESKNNNDSFVSANIGSVSNDTEKIKKSGYELLTNGGEFGDVNFAYYVLYDIDNDKTEEIIIRAGTCEADATIIIYKYLNGTYEQIGYSDGNHCEIHGNKNEDGIIVHHGVQGVESAYLIKIQDNKLVEKELISPHEVSGDYTEFDYCIRVMTYDINDYSPFDKYKSEASFDNEFVSGENYNDYDKTSSNSNEEKAIYTYQHAVLSGATIIQSDSTTGAVKYKQKCENCGYISSSTVSVYIKNSTLNTSFLCPKCQNNQEVKIQGVMDVDWQ